MKKILPLLLCIATASLSLACGGEDEGSTNENPFAADDAAAISAGEELFTDQACGSCHLESGTGLGSNLAETAGDLSDAEVYKAIAEGSANGTMLGYEDDLDSDQIWQLVTYIRTL